MKKKTRKETEGLFALLYKNNNNHVMYVTPENKLLRMTTDPNEAEMFATKTAAWKYAMDHNLSTSVKVIPLI